jgi:hypothetical protein
MKIIPKTLNRCVTLLPRKRVVDKTTYPCERSVRLQIGDFWVPRYPWHQRCTEDPNRYGRPCIMALMYILDDEDPAESEGHGSAQH